MSFQVEPSALRTFDGQLGDAAADAANANTYIRRYTDFGWHAEGLMSQLQTAHEHFVSELTSGLAHLQHLLEQSKTEMDGAAAYYERTDRAAAARLDATYPEAPRPSVHDRH